MRSCLYVGTLRHRRHRPRLHAFRYRLYMTYLDLAELDRVFAGRWLWSTRARNLVWLRRADYLGDPAVPLEEAVRARVQAETGRRPTGAIRMLTHLRAWGWCFNPLTVYYCFDAAGQLESVVAEITNTPWGERHSYVLSRPEPGTKAAGHERGGHPDSHRAQLPDHIDARFAKAFHVSPFMEMQLDYDWRFDAPGPALHINMRNERDGVLVFDAHLRLERRPLTSLNMAAALVRFPLMPLKVSAAIYFEALRLWFKRTPFHPHPGPRDPHTTVEPIR